MTVHTGTVPSLISRIMQWIKIRVIRAIRVQKKTAIRAQKRIIIRGSLFVAI